MTNTPPDVTRPEAHLSIRTGVLWMVIAMFCFVTMDAMAKELVKTHSVVQVVWGRYFFQVVILAGVLAPRLRKFMMTDRLGLQLVRSILLLATTALYFSGLQFVPLAEASAIMMLSPLVVTALSAPILKEHVGVRRWSGVLIGFCGGLIIIRPGGDALQLAALLPLGAAMIYGFYQISTRFLSQSESVLTTLCYSALVGGILMSVWVPFHWSPLAPYEWGMLVGAGLAGCIGHFALIKSFTAAPAAAVAPFTYTNVIWAASYGILVFGEWPDHWTLIGAAVIAGSGLYIYRREQRVKAKA
ncbi:MAG: DMT family transporter [Rhodospirillaceae bacterium]